MSDKYLQNDSPVGALKSESARQRWELFHRAISHAKNSNNRALQDSEISSSEAEERRPLLSIAQ
jgi:hypothetical protein